MHTLLSFSPMTTSIPFYDPKKSYHDNCEKGPFGAFANTEKVISPTPPHYKVLGLSLNAPIGIPAGPVPNAKFCQAAFDKGYSMVVYKTVRTRAFPCHPFPNIIPVQTSGVLSLEEASRGLIQDSDFHDPIAITNSFGVPSLSPDIWQPDMAKAVHMAHEGQVLIGSFQATKTGEGRQSFLDDWKHGAKLIMETGVKAVEINFSCPNEGHNALLCHDTAMAEDAARVVKEILQDTPLIVKMAYFPQDAALEDFITRLSPFVDGFSAINTIAAAVRTENSEQALPGEGRLVSGICGAPIKWAGISMTQRMHAIRAQKGLSFDIIGCGGVITKEDYAEYRSAGADAVMSATGAMWNPLLAKEVIAMES